MKVKEWIIKHVYEPTGVMKKKMRFITAGVTLLILLAGALYLYYHNPIKGLGIGCPIYTFTGYYCPGCGAGRACYSILHGRFYQAFRYNPLLVLMLPWLGLYYFTCGLQWLFKGRETLSTKIPYWIPAVLLVALYVYAVLRNIDVYPFTVLAPTRI